MEILIVVRCKVIRYQTVFFFILLQLAAWAHIIPNSPDRRLAGAPFSFRRVLNVRGAWVQVIQAMKPNALPPLADRYCTAINSLLRRELHAYTTELKRSAMARVAASPPEPDIVKGSRKVQLPLLEHAPLPLTRASQHTNRRPATATVPH